MKYTIDARACLSAFRVPVRVYCVKLARKDVKSGLLSLLRSTGLRTRFISGLRLHPD